MHRSPQHPASHRPGPRTHAHTTMPESTTTIPANQAELEVYLQTALSGLEAHDPATLTADIISAHLYHTCAVPDAPRASDATASAAGAIGPLTLNAPAMAEFFEGRVRITKQGAFKPSFEGTLAGGAEQWVGPAVGKVDVLGYADDITFHALAGRTVKVPFIKDYMIMLFFKDKSDTMKGNFFGVFVGEMQDSGTYTIGSGNFTD
ncbi:hypothetical protein HYPSUDRAFT_88607 [Hypholoma sublateritium FD-334 SS-4]|uniref:Uncharacterized protein n=1 Tax=Hypholoma sublateritium (strain FD-334 SS-4) TaxID=945553 RepID=A0A0D2PL74_HYPSF|nr:hypothetical protein HYPSUDRAFT_88607 [Hypholoma sublateritium FD-334 SS-4]